jgi:3'(2'), 5'-bisphosphate nucleotidase
MQPLPLARLLDRVEQIALAAGEAIMQVYAGEFEVTQKPDASPVTAADMAANEVILHRLAQLQPALPVLSEESVEAFSGPDAAGRYWLVDPLDGTKEFIKRNGEFSVNIALIEQGRPVLGVVHAPALGVTWLGAQGVGAFKRDATGVRQPIRVARRAPGTPWRVLGSRSHLGPKTLAWMEALGDYTLTRRGCSIKLCLVAEGAADLYPRLGPTSLWDTAAGHAIVDAAGGCIKTPAGEVISYAHPERTLNPWFVVYGGSEPVLEPLPDGGERR